MRTIVPLFLSVDDFWNTYEDERVIKEVFWNDMRNGSMKDFLSLRVWL